MLPLALPGAYDYLVPDETPVAPGQFVMVPLGPVERLGAVWTRKDEQAAPVRPEKLREIIEVLDDLPKLPRVSLEFADWMANYTLTPPGMVLRMMMSAAKAFDPPAPRYGVRLAGPEPARMTPARTRVIEAAKNGLIWVKSSLAEAAGVSVSVLDGLVDAGTLIAEPLPDWDPAPLDLSRERATLTAEQAKAAKALVANASDGFAVTLLDGVTGSGKTEVYFEAIATALGKGRQALVLMPETISPKALLSRESRSRVSLRAPIMFALTIHVSRGRRQPSKRWWRPTAARVVIPRWPSLSRFVAVKAPDCISPWSQKGRGRVGLRRPKRSFFYHRSPSCGRRGDPTRARVSSKSSSSPWRTRSH